MKTIRIGSRKSRLAVIQSQIVMDAIHAFDPTIRLELVTMKTTGDKILNQTLDKIGGKGLFVKELDQALLDCKVDITVHSSKDLPMDIDESIPIVAVSEREDPRDVLVLPEGQNELQSNKPIGSSSIRRKLQLEGIFPGVEVAPVRGNVQSRLKKLDEGQYAGLVLAAAGLHRLGLKNRISRFFAAKEMIPAAGQGIIAVQGRAGEDLSFLAKLHDKDTALCLSAERAFVKSFNGGCSSPIAAYAMIKGNQLYINGLNIEEGAPITKSITGNKEDAEALGILLAERLRRARP